MPAAVLGYLGEVIVHIVHMLIAYSVFSSLRASSYFLVRSLLADVDVLSDMRRTLRVHYTSLSV